MLNNNFFIFDDDSLKNPINSIKFIKSPTRRNLDKYIAKNKAVESRFSFVGNFPNIIKFLENINKNYASDLLLAFDSITYEKTAEEKAIMADDFLRLNINKNLADIEKDIEPVFGEEWNKLSTYFDGRTKIHILITLVFVYTDIFHSADKLNEKLSQYDINTLLWAVMLHDLSKHVILNESLGEVFKLKMRSYDKIHPFKSGAAALTIFLRNNFFKYSNEEDKKCIEELVKQSYHLLVNSVDLRMSKRPEKKSKK